MATQNLTVPDIGGTENVEVIEVCVKPGDTVSKDDSLFVLESDKASMEVPAPMGGTVKSIQLKVGDKVSQGSPMLVLDVEGSAAAAPAKVEPPVPAVTPAPAPVVPPQTSAPVAAAVPAPIDGGIPVPVFAPVPSAATAPATQDAETEIYAGPAVRKLAREMAIDLARVAGSGPKSRIQKDDLKLFVKNLMENRSPARGASGGAGIPAVPDLDFAQFGPVDMQVLTSLQKTIVSNMHRAWLNVPHVTQWDDADITELEDFRGTLKDDMEKRGVKLSPLPFLFKAVAAGLKAHPKFCASLCNDGVNIVYKKYIHIGMAVDTQAGLVVPVLRDVDKKSIWELAAETAELAQKAKDRKLKVAEMQGACFTISSLGNIGGLGFTPIVNTPEVGILGVSKLQVKPQWNGSEFVPRKMLPLSLSYDHRVINGGDAGRFLATLNQLLGDIRRLVL